MAIKTKYLIKAWISTLLGGLITVMTTLVSWIIDGSFNWKAFAASFGIAVILAFTDLFKELKKQIDEEDAPKLKNGDAGPGGGTNPPPPPPPPAS